MKATLCVKSLRSVSYCVIPGQLILATFLLFTLSLSLSRFSIREFLVWVLRKKHLKLKIRQKVISMPFNDILEHWLSKVCSPNRQYRIRIRSII